MIATIKFECGETTCASEPGKFCRFLIPGGPYCKLFVCGLQYKYPTGEFQRCEQCLEECGKEEER